MKEKVKIRIEIWSKTVVMQVLHLDEKLRGKGLLFKNDSISLKSDISPALFKDVVYLNGKNKKSDNYARTFSFSSNKEAQEYVNKVNKCVEEFNNQPEDLVIDISKQGHKKIYCSDDEEILLVWDNRHTMQVKRAFTDKFLSPQTEYEILYIIHLERISLNSIESIIQAYLNSIDLKYNVKVVF